VNAVKNYNDGLIYAMKTTSKAFLLESGNNFVTLWNERMCMSQINSSYVVQLHWAFQDKENCYLVMDFMRGGDFRWYLDTHDPMPEKQCRFYAVELLLAMEELNKHHIIYRDLKPNNLLLDEDGHLHLSDFGLTKVLKGDTRARGASGTFGYVAPEIVAGRSYRFECDSWSYGVTLYEFLHKRLPFPTRNTLMSKQAVHVSSTMSPACRELLERLLYKDAKRRLVGSSHGWDEIKSHDWFKGVDWELAETRGITPPYIPPKGVANCNSTFELEDVFFGQQKQRPLTEEEEKKFVGYNFRTRLVSRRQWSTDHNETTVLLSPADSGRRETVLAPVTNVE